MVLETKSLFYVSNVKGEYWNFFKELLPTGTLDFIVFCVLPCTNHKQQVRSFDILRFKQQLYVHVLIENNRYIKSFHKKTVIFRQSIWHYMYTFSRRSVLNNMLVLLFHVCFISLLGDI